MFKIKGDETRYFLADAGRVRKIGGQDSEISKQVEKEKKHYSVIKFIDDTIKNFDSLTELEKYQFVFDGGVDSLIQKKEFGKASNILKDLDLSNEDVAIATMKMKCIIDDKDLKKAVDISEQIMANESINWKDNVDFLLESSVAYLAYNSLDHGHTWDECNHVLETFLYPAKQKDSHDIRVLTDISQTLSIMATTKKMSEEEQEKNLEKSLDNLRKAEDVSVDDVKIYYTWCVYAIQRADIEDERKNSNKDEVLKWRTVALEKLNKAIKLEPGVDLSWYTKSTLELDLEQEEDAFYSAITAFCLYDPDSAEDSLFEQYENHANNFNDRERRSQLCELLEKKKTDF